MPGDLTPEHVLEQLEKGRLHPVYLFYGQSEFRLEKVLGTIRESFIPEGARDFNLGVFYGGDSITKPADIMDAARSLPFMSENRLIIVRRTEEFAGTALEGFIPYIEAPSESTCLIFITSGPDFRKKFYKRIRKLGFAVNFRPLYDNQVVPWIKKMAGELGLTIEDRARAYLQQIVGNRMRDLYSELEKLYLRHGKTAVGLEEVEELAIYGRIYSVFELMDKISLKRRSEALLVLKRFMEEEDREAVFKVIGMLNRQIRLLWRTKCILEGGGRRSEVARKLKLQDFQVKGLIPQSRLWTDEDLERALDMLYQADGLLKSGSRDTIVLENLVLSLCA